MMMMYSSMCALLLLLVVSWYAVVDAWVSAPQRTSHRQPLTTACRATRRNILLGTSVSTLTTILSLPNVASALIKGNAPPPKQQQKISSERPKCTNVEECQRLAEEKEAELQRQAQESANPISSIKGTKYYDIQAGSGDDIAKTGNEVTVFYKVLKLGKRSYDGLSGEGTVVFSRGYGLEDDESAAREKSFTTTLGNLSNIVAFNNALIGMKTGGIRRFSVFPDQGWRKPGQACDGGPGGSGAGGDLKTDYVVVPTATMVATEACFDTNKRPFPTSYAEQRRMAQRFDQSLIMEVELVKIGKESALLF